MSDYYYFDDKKSEWGYTPILGDDYIEALFLIQNTPSACSGDEWITEELARRDTSSALLRGSSLSIAKRKGVKITKKMIMNEIFNKDEKDK